MEKPPLTIWVDNDGCPTYIREMVIKSSTSLPLQVIFVANSYMRLPKYHNLKMIVVSGKFDAADQHIIDHVEKGQLVLTSDVPLAYAVVQKGAVTINSRGEEINASNASERLVSRNLTTEMRSPMQAGGGPKPVNPQDIKKFADKWQALVHKLITAL